MKTYYRGFFALLGTSFIYGIFGVIARALGPYLTANQMTFLRALIVLSVIGVMLLIKKIPILKINKESILPLIIHSVTFGFTIFLFTYAVFLTSLSKATFSFYTTTLISSLFASIFIFKEGFHNRKKISFVLALCGLIFFVLPTGIKTIDTGMLMTGIAGVNDVVTNSMKKYLGGQIDRLVLVFYQMLTGVVFGALLLFVTKEYSLLAPFNLGGILWLLFFALNFFLLSYLAAYGFQHFDLNLGTIILSMEFVFASIAGFILYHETLSLYQIIAIVLLGGSIVVMNLPTRKVRTSHRK